MANKSQLEILGLMEETGSDILANDTQSIIASLNIDSLIPNERNEAIFGYDDSEVTALAEEMKRNGDLAPIVVADNEDGTYEIISGHKRYLAHRKLGDERVDAIVRQGLTREQRQYKLIMSNFMQRDLSSLAWAKGLKEMLDSGLSERIANGEFTDENGAAITDKNIVLGKIVGKSDRTIRRYLALLDINDNILDLVSKKKIEADALNAFIKPSLVPQEIQEGVYAIICEALESEEYKDSDRQMTQAEIRSFISRVTPKQKKEKSASPYADYAKAIASLCSKRKALAKKAKSVSDMDKDSLKLISKKSDVDSLKALRDELDELIGLLE